MSVDPRIAAEFGSRDGDPIDETAADVHVRATAHLDALGVTVDEQAYLAAVETVSNNIAAAAPHGALERHLEAASALGDLAWARLPPNASDVDYVGELESIESEFGLRYFDWDSV